MTEQEKINATRDFMQSYCIKSQASEKCTRDDCGRCVIEEAWEMLFHVGRYYDGHPLI